MKIKILKSKPTIEGAGVNLKRAFGYHEVPKLDPFLLLDDFGSDDPHDYILGFPWHPHRGIETVTYVIRGVVEHEDSLGNKGSIQSGDVQWMTAGSGIIHQEMPQQYKGTMRGFQLWVNLPSYQKMIDPKYRDIRQEQIPEITVDNGIKVKIICGEVNRVRGPVRDIVVDPEYFDISIAPHKEFTLRVKKGYRAFAYVFEGEGYFHPEKKKLITAEHLVIFDDADNIKIEAHDQSMRLLYASGKPIGEPVAWYGPIVMNTQEELDLAFEEYRKRTFIKHGRETGIS